MIDSKMIAAAVILQRTARLRRRPKETALVRAQTAVIPLERKLVPFRGRPSAAVTVLIVGIVSLMIGLDLPRIWGGATGPMVHLTVKSVHAGTSLPIAAPIGSSVSNVLEIIQRAGAGDPDLHTLVGSDGRRLGSHSRVTMPATMHLVLRPVAPVPLPSNTIATRTEEGDRVRTFGELGTLYARCGGIMGVASFVDRCMDKWMADPTLNANARVVSWHARSQRCGFKFLVTQLLGYLTGGPQRYTGKSMALAHKHLAITAGEWDAFMGTFYEVTEEFNLPSSDVEDLQAVLLSMRDDCVAEGTAADAHPAGATKTGGSFWFGSASLYERLGGLYPIALFVDRLIDALLADPRVAIPVDGQRRNEASMKYLFTEVVCAIVGGPELVTSLAFAETRLLLPARQMFFLLEAAKDASDHFHSSKLRAELLQALHQASADYIVDQRTTSPPSQRHSERAVKIEALSALAGVPLIYIPKGGVVRITFDASPAQLEQVAAGLADMGLKTVDRTKVKTASDAANGNLLSSAVIAARHAAPGAFVAARRRCFGDPRTLYGRTGGVFGLATLADALMEAWMAEPTLNANTLVTRWHTSQQRAGFKFLVTQILGYLSGGPQRYTGRPMDVAHKHLGITAGEWDAFLATAKTVLTAEAALTPELREELLEILTPFAQQVVSPEGAELPPDPQLSTTHPDGNSLFAEAGGVYPLARFADLLVERVLADELVLPLSKRAGGKLSRAGLKYLLTELLCNAAGGAEIVTSKGFDDAKLGVNDWRRFLSAARETAARVWNDKHVSGAVLAELEGAQAELIVGLEASDGGGEGAAARQKMREAGFGHVEITAALQKAKGDGVEALDLLVRGWKPVRSQTGGAQAGGCPFSRGGGAGATASPHRGVPGSGANPGGARRAGGRVLGSPLQARLDLLLTEDTDLSCPITLLLFQQPVVASDGGIYERAAVAKLTQLGGLSPITHRPLSPELSPAEDVKMRATAFMSVRALDLLQFAQEAHTADAYVMAVQAAERAKEYVAALDSEDRDPALVRKLRETWRALGRSPPPVDQLDPYERVAAVLDRQVAQAKAEAEAAAEEAAAEEAASSFRAPVRKSIVFTIDASYSMNQLLGRNQGDHHQLTRMDSARANLLMILDEHIEDGDTISVITFADDVRTDVPATVVTPHNRLRLRGKAERACRARGATAFYDSLVASAKMLDQHPTIDEGEPRWIIALTDGEDNRSKKSVHETVRVLRRSKSAPDLLVVGVQLHENTKPFMMALAATTDNSKFIDASGGIESLNDAFEEVAELIAE
ncbi:hypothetical protein EMIHUDRAFT_434239 [Emiliania huxleyi CCMP1516]|uniref:VWFA domain-containing protein n=2 Tax=Emiliania huxleyi TaxID=2903 RepID=A0A0D3K8S7_EMIH1|nr:hypothetical protein EMIHUDRAFT_434239 [Emiliania huxleyi CCMP1516]EOD32162.1 hypothetical protein EMIHUDRAFT_434239 [Emiliania huxleyi CCMP1516]|eukprot:XP_005784591.1 hypothetical protein EMIHUDRAFT_434239 [Emiliania huxleyi CCMP1516]